MSIDSEEAAILVVIAGVFAAEGNSWDADFVRPGFCARRKADRADAWRVPKERPGEADINSLIGVAVHDFESVVGKR
jgi:hypothetical protein